MSSAYKHYVEHPRYGRGPNLTGVNGGETGWRYHRESVIPDTGVLANIERQRFPYLAELEIYYDLEKVCQDCDRPFIFFAREQQHWYEVLQFPVDSDCVRCTDCRAVQRQYRQLRTRYEELVVIARDDRTWEQNLELAELAIELAERGALAFRSYQHVRACLNAIPDSQRHRRRYHAAWAAVERLESTT